MDPCNAVQVEKITGDDTAQDDLTGVRREKGDPIVGEGIVRVRHPEDSIETIRSIRGGTRIGLGPYRGARYVNVSTWTRTDTAGAGGKMTTSIVEGDRGRRIGGMIWVWKID